MKHTTILALFLAAGLCFVIPLAGAVTNERGGSAQEPSVEITEETPVTDTSLEYQQETTVSPTVEPKKEQLATPLGMPVYRPPLRGAPGGRVGGGTRGTSGDLPLLSVLTPDHTGLTVQQQPSLYWFLSELVNCPVELTVIEDRAIRPLLEKRIAFPEQPGVQCIRLADHGVRLQKETHYKWFVAFVPDPNCRSKDTIAGGTIECVDFPNHLRAKLGEAGKTKSPHVYAEAGLWYDALSAISNLIETSPNDTVLRKQRASLLEQAGLPEIAGYDMKGVGQGAQPH